MGLRDWLSNLTTAPNRAAEARLTAIVSRIATLSADQVRAEVERELEGGRRFRCEAAPLPADGAGQLRGLPPIAREFFSRYKKVESNSMELDRDEITPYARGQDFVQIGTDIADTDVILDRGTDVVAVVEDDGQRELNLEDSHVSIWHYLLYVMETARA